MAEEITNNEAENRYELQVEGGTAVAAYERRGDIIAFTHTRVPEKLRGRGLARKLIEAALSDVRKRGLKILPECAFVIDYVGRHPEVRDLVAD